MANAVNSAQYQARIRQTETLFEGQKFYSAPNDKFKRRI